MTAYVLELFLS